MQARLSQGFEVVPVRVQNSMGDLEIMSNNEQEKNHEKELKPEER